MAGSAELQWLVVSGQWLVNCRLVTVLSAIVDVFLSQDTREHDLVYTRRGTKKAFWGLRQRMVVEYEDDAIDVLVLPEDVERKSYFEQSSSKVI